MHTQSLASFRAPAGLEAGSRRLVAGSSGVERHLSPRPRAAGPALQRNRQLIAAASKGQDPPDVPKERQGGREWLQSILSRFGPIKERATNTTVLDFEKPLVELDNRIREVGRVEGGPWGVEGRE